jgi:hypothetical protein
MDADQILHRIEEAAEMQRRGEALGERVAGGVADRCRVVHGVAHDGGIGGAHDDQRQFVGDGVERVLDYLQ